jgi:hypothetical protein
MCLCFYAKTFDNPSVYHLVPSMKEGYGLSPPYFTPHCSLTDLMIQVVGQTWVFSKSTRSWITSSRSLTSDTSGPHTNIVWHTAIDSGTVSGELLHAPHILRA